MKHCSATSTALHSQVTPQAKPAFLCNYVHAAQTAVTALQVFLLRSLVPFLAGQDGRHR